MFWLVFFAALAVQFGLYALFRSYKASADRIAANELSRVTRRRLDGGQFIGARNRLGED